MTDLLGQVCEWHLPLQVPQHRAVHLHALQQKLRFSQVPPEVNNAHTSTAGRLALQGTRCHRLAQVPKELAAVHSLQAMDSCSAFVTSLSLQSCCWI